jgi:hypothetical protein
MQKSSTTYLKTTLRTEGRVGKVGEGSQVEK